MPRNFSSWYRTPITSMSAARGIWWRAIATTTSPPPSFPSSDGCRGRRDFRSVLGTESKRIKVTIEADLFRVMMKLETLDKYSVSYSLYVQPQRGGALRRPRLAYIYQNDTQVPVTPMLNLISGRHSWKCLRTVQRSKALIGRHE